MDLESATYCRVCAIYVEGHPARLIHMLEELEQKILKRNEFGWNIKLVEKSGLPLNLLFRKRSPVIADVRHYKINKKNFS